MPENKKPITTLRSPLDLVEAGMIAPEAKGDIAKVAERYAIAISPTMAALIDGANPHDPIARQFVPSEAELITTPNELTDPIGDEAHSPVKGIVHRYPDRVLLKMLHTCPVYCRFCFRREVVGPSGAGNLTEQQQDDAIAYIAAHPQIWEVILTGGDPLMLSPRRISQVMQKLGSIDHVKIIRWHTRVPIVTPERVTQAMAEALCLPNKATYIAIHANHPREFTPQACQAVRHLRDAGVVLVSQSVLLKGVNNDANILEKLMRVFVENGIKPYYLHHPDLAKGTSHFRVSIADGQGLMRVLQGRLSGLCQPTYVLDISGGFGKAPIGAGYATQNANGSWQVQDYNGASHLVGEV
jgi:lysine 2,3-aminomutase